MFNMNFIISICVLVFLFASSGNAEKCILTAAPPDPKSGCCGRPIGVDKSKFSFHAQLSEYPWMSIILQQEVTNLKVMCSAALISGRYLLTAALCFGDFAIRIGSPATVRLGEYNITNNGPDCVDIGGSKKCNDGALNIPIEKVIIHPDYQWDKSYQNDIALIRLAQMVPKTDFIQPICLPTSDVTAMPLNQRLWTAGWGIINEANTGLPERLLHVDLPYVDLETCQLAFNNITSSPQIELGSGQFCAGGEKGKGSCRSDSGGPLMYVRDGITELAGIVSFGAKLCGRAGVPGVFTKVFAYDAWIRANIEP